MSAEKPRRLGRGLEALIGSTQTVSVPASDLQQISTSRIKPNPYQPRREFDPEALAELEASIKTNGLLQPITVRRKGDSYELVAGERRLRAVTNLQWKEIPAVVRDFDDQTLLVLALVENLQRSDLNAIEEARGYQRLLGEFSLTHQEIAEAVGKERSTITNLLRVLTLPDPIQRFVESGKLSGGHARALAGVANDEAITIANQIIADGLSVRQTEHRVRQSRSGADGSRGAAERSLTSVRKRDPAVRQIEDQLRHYLQTDVQVELNGDSKGAIRMSFYSSDDLERLLELILKDSREELR